MKSSTLINGLILVMCAGFLVALFGKTVGLPDWAEEVGTVVGGACAICGFLIQRRAKRLGNQVSMVAPEQRTKRKWLFILLVAAVTLSSPLWLPFAGITLSLPQLIISAIVSCAFAVMAVLLGIRLAGPKT